jgi:hypothetical protein
VSALPLYLLLAALSAPWWLPLLRVLLADLRVAGEPDEDTVPRSASLRASPLRAVDADTRTPLNRVLAFRGVARRVESRRRWEGGFGRRGL